MTTQEIRPKQLRALLLLLVLVPLIPIALMARFLTDALAGSRMEAMENLQQSHAQILGSALRTAPELAGTAQEQAGKLLAHIQDSGDTSVSIRIVDGKGRWLAGEQAPHGQLLAQEGAPGGLDGLVQLYLAGPEVLDEAIAGQRRIFIATGVVTTLAVLFIAAAAALAVSRQITLQELKATSVAIVAHELRTPLASMRMLVDTLREGRCRDEKQRAEYLDLIAGENERLRRIAENFLIFSRLERGRQALDLAPVSPLTVATEATGPLMPRLTARGCTFMLDVPETLPEIRADADALAQVLANLLDNALKYTGDEKRIALRARAEGRMVAFLVEDDGIGVAPEQRGAIFEPFHQVDQRLTRSREGAGLGLAIVKRIVKAHRGEISVAGGPGKGSVFTVKIPVA